MDRRGLTESPVPQEVVTSQPLPPWRVGPASQEPRKRKRRGLRQLQVGELLGPWRGPLAFLWG